MRFSAFQRAVERMRSSACSGTTRTGSFEPCATIARHSWLLGMEAFDTIRSYSVEAARTLSEAVSNAGAELYLGELCAAVRGVLRMCARTIIFDSSRAYVSITQTTDCVCTHGGVDPRVARVEEQRREAVIWGAGNFPDGYEGAALVVYGHWNNAALNADGWPAPTMVGRTIGIDTISHGVLTAIRLPDRRIFQSARYESAELRRLTPPAADGAGRIMSAAADACH